MTRMQLKKMQAQRQRRQRRIRAALFGTAQRPRVSVYRSNQHVYVQAIDDNQGRTLTAGYDGQLTGTKTERAQAVAKNVAAALKKMGVSAVIFDRGYYRYHGRVRAVADTLRAEGIQV